LPARLSIWPESLPTALKILDAYLAHWAEQSQKKPLSTSLKSSRNFANCSKTVLFQHCDSLKTSTFSKAPDMESHLTSSALPWPRSGGAVAGQPDSWVPA
jgi:hypothetical protein